MGGYQASLVAHKAQLPTFKDVRFQAIRDRTFVVARVLMADDTIATVKVGPRGGVKILAPY